MNTTDKKSRTEFEENFDKHNTMLKRIPYGLLFFDPHDSYKYEGQTHLKCIYYNDNILSMFEVSESDFENLYLTNIIGVFFKESAARIETAFRTVINTKVTTSFDCTLHLINGNIKYIKAVIEYLVGHDNKDYLIASVIDNTETKMKEIKYETMLSFDPVTGVYNKNHFIKQAEMVIDGNKEEQFDLIYVSIVDYQSIRDTLGSDASEEALHRTVDVIVKRAEYMQYKDVAYGRVSQASFAYIIPERIRDREFVRNMFPLCFNVDGNDKPFSLHLINVPLNDKSITVAKAIDYGAYASKFLKNSESAFFDIDENFINQYDIAKTVATDFEKALKNNEFVVNYQPIYSIKTGTIVCAESLVRWNHPVKGAIYPSSFIPYFEDNLSIIKLDKYIWEEVFKDISKSGKAKTLCPIAINVSRVDFLNTHIVGDILSLVDKYGLEPKNIVIEITETAALDKKDRFISFIDDLQVKGFKVSMDDFGSEYSTLSSLSELHVDSIKLDSSFAKKITTPRCQKIVSSILSLSKSLDMRLIAEGIENEEQAIIYNSLGVEYIQGFYYSSPLSFKDFLDLEATKKDTFSNKMLIQSPLPQTSAILSPTSSKIRDSIAMFTYDEKTKKIRMTWFNENYHNGLDYSWNEYTKLKDEELFFEIYPQDKKELLSLIFKAIKGEKIDPTIIRAYKKNHDIVYRSLSIETFSANEETCFCIILSDVSRYIAIEQSLKNYQDRFKLYLGKLCIFTFKYDIKADMLEYDFSEAGDQLRVFKNFRNVLSNIKEDELYKTSKEALLNILDIADKEVINQKVVKILANIKGRGFRWCLAIFSSLVDSKGHITGLIGRCEDINEFQEEEEKRLNDANFDLLTGVYTRRAFMSLFEEKLDPSDIRVIYGYFFDIDDFKEINDKYGHYVGDEVLVNFGKAVNKVFDKNALSTRWGGDEILTIDFEIETEDKAIAKANKVASMLLNNPLFEKIKIKITLSTGIIPITSNMNFETIYKKVDKAMYKSKRRGKDKITIL